jgi:hypothetical protein
MGALNATLFIALKHFDSFEAAIQANTNLGGDNCHRGAAIGMLLGLAHGKEFIPQRWLFGLHRNRDLAPLISSCASLALKQEGQVANISSSSMPDGGGIDWQAKKRSGATLDVEKQCGL